MGNFIFSLIFGLIPETLYFTLFLIFAKNIKEKKIKLFLLISLSYILCIMTIRYKLLLYVVFIFVIYGILKILYKKKAMITDIFLFAISTLYLTIVSYLFYIFRNKFFIDGFVSYVIIRLILFIPLILLRNKINEFYKIYCRFWNRNDKEKRPIKSITLRNVSLMGMNILIIIMNICALIKSGILS